MTQKAHASPTKDFFISMITKDITLEACLLDLLDNSFDGASKSLRKHGVDDLRVADYNGYEVYIDFNAEHFSIVDNCGGISVEEAVNYAFHFGRKKNAPIDTSYGIGLYGIGMKRAILKLGKTIIISSSTDEEAFSVEIDVNAWAEAEDWDFDLNTIGKKDIPGTHIEVKNLDKDISEEFSDPVFVNNLINNIARDYSFIIQRGFKVFINGTNVIPHPYCFRVGDDFKPIKFEYADENGVLVSLTAGMSGLPPDDTDADTPDPADVDYYGWFVTCNDRVVLAGDKSKDTVWGDEGFPSWHPQYNGFAGLISFYSEDPKLLPWTTTKTEIETMSKLYRRAILKMKEATRAWIDYTNRRKTEVEDLKAREQRSIITQIRDLPTQQTLITPIFSAKPRVATTSITYIKPIEELNRVKRALGSPLMTNKDAGLKTFKYYFDNEVDD